MGVNLKDLFERDEIKIEDLSGKIIAVDAFNMIFQFLSTIRGRDGSLLKDSHGNVTSHLVGLFSRTSHLMLAGVLPVFVFDGKAPVLKKKEQARRLSLKREAEKEYNKAVEEGDVEAMRKFAARSLYVDESSINDAKELVSLLGLPVVQAPSEGEAQAAHIVKNGDAWAVGSQDYDSLVHGTPRLIQNLSIAGKRKHPKTLAYRIVSPEIIELKKNLDRLGISQKQLILLSMLVGTDYNHGGVKGIGPQKALKLVREFKSAEDLFSEVKWSEHCDVPWKDVLHVFEQMHVSDSYEIKFSNINSNSLINFLVDKHDFGSARVLAVIKNIELFQQSKTQKGLSAFFNQ
ncbi:flap endonuclease-1 [Candidatus Woesearchaeota archaeon]|nr:flap endonuclease-1 [Candidatus Woesearchaeota archaeon]